jgi:hypothetical protein
MKERPILFSAPMVRAILAGQKTQTRRVVKPEPQMVTHDRKTTTWEGDPGVLLDLLEQTGRKCRYGKPGDRLWVRETFQRFSDDGEIMYRADPASLRAMNELKYDECQEARWRPSIHMPRWASRILLEVVSVRVERLNDISESDLAAEGIQELIDGGVDHDGTPLDTYRVLWESINGRGSWESNPWVWVVEFERAEA